MTSSGFIGVTMHWINVSDEGKWALKSAVIGMKGITGDHSGKNLGRFVVAVCNCIGLIGKQKVI